nr:MAG TPA: hypothetical protein [Caudoviricetes sp.]
MFSIETLKVIYNHLCWYQNVKERCVKIWLLPIIYLLL